MFQNFIFNFRSSMSSLTWRTWWRATAKIVLRMWMLGRSWHRNTWPTCDSLLIGPNLRRAAWPLSALSFLIRRRGAVLMFGAPVCDSWHLGRLLKGALHLPVDSYIGSYNAPLYYGATGKTTVFFIGPFLSVSSRKYWSYISSQPQEHTRSLTRVQIDNCRDIQPQITNKRDLM